MSIIIYSLNTELLDDKASFDTNYRTMPFYRRRKIDAMRFDKDKRLSLGAGMLLNRALRDAVCRTEEHLEIQSADSNPALSAVIDVGDVNTVICDIPEFEIAYGTNGKPYFPEIEDKFQFNLSHSGSRVMCIAACSQASETLPLVGCDVEQIKDIGLDIARKYFTADEFELIMTSDAQREMFYRIWTLKESFMKATGLGMALALDEFSIGFNKAGSAVVEQRVDNREYTFGEYAPGDGYRYAWCVSEK